MLRAFFSKNDNHWNLQSISPIATSEVPDDHRLFVQDVARAYFEGPRPVRIKKGASRFDLAILQDANEAFPPSDARAIQKFTKAAEKLGFYVEQIGKEDYGRLAEFDALFIRETTGVNHHTYRFARRAEAEGLVVIDDPKSILKCTNKVYLAELLRRNGIQAPKTVIINEETKERVPDELSFPCIEKQPDSSFSQGVVKVENKEDLNISLSKLFSSTELLIAQEYLPTEFDWRVGILNRTAIYVCKYYMARKHWQIYERSQSGRTYSGKAEAIPVDEAPLPVVQTALKAAALIGDGLYGVDLKQIGNKVYVLEINDNPSIDSGYEDAILKEDLYDLVMREILRRLERKKAPNQKLSDNLDSTKE